LDVAWIVQKVRNKRARNQNEINKIMKYVHFFGRIFCSVKSVGENKNILAAKTKSFADVIKMERFCQCEE
jgi:hypothetical protein